MTRQHHQCGITLIEVLITAFVMAVGLLGMAALQLNGLNTNHDAYYRSQATLFATDLADRMRANLDAARDGAYVAADAPSDPGYDCQTSFPAATSCSGTELAAADLYQWYQRLGDTATGLPSAQASVTCPAPCDTGTPYTIALAWDEDRSGDVTAADPTLNLQVVP